mgnify:CR=1 FL=1
MMCTVNDDVTYDDLALHWGDVTDVTVIDGLPQRFIIPGVVDIDMTTGRVVLHVEVDEAARQFWDAVQTIAGRQP